MGLRIYEADFPTAPSDEDLRDLWALLCHEEGRQVGFDFTVSTMPGKRLAFEAPLDGGLPEIRRR